ncbi:MAG: lysoplasmalogenase [Bacteroidetes bacterium]|nr:lysoplasmalogenase [Bacteroidota bacterium]
MLLIKKYGMPLFLVVLILHIACIYLEMSTLRLITKLLLLPILILYLTAEPGKTSVVVYMGLFCSFMGDLLLTRSGEIFFLSGMLAFIGTHVCNILFFYRLQKGHPGKPVNLVLAVVVLAVISGGVYFLLADQLGSFRVPILVYMAIISLMAVMATQTLVHPGLIQTSIRCFIPGAALFVLSDGLLALNKFLLHTGSIDIAVMLTYGMAQYLLVKGFVAVKKEKTVPTP